MFRIHKKNQIELHEEAIEELEKKVSALYTYLKLDEWEFVPKEIEKE